MLKRVLRKVRSAPKVPLTNSEQSTVNDAAGVLKSGLSSDVCSCVDTAGKCCTTAACITENCKSLAPVGKPIG